MHRRSIVRWSFALAFLPITALWACLHGLSVPAAELGASAGWTGTLGGLAIVCQWRRGDRLEIGLVAILQCYLFAVAFLPLMYLVGSLGRPLIDQQLVAADARLGFHLPNLLAWRNEHSNIDRVLCFCYDSMVHQMFAVIVIGSLLGERRSVENFVLRFMVSLIIVLVCYGLWPAEGPFVSYDFVPSPPQARYLEQLHAIRQGTLTVLRQEEVVGLVTFPSFHTTWAVLLAFALPRRWWLTVPLVVLNLGVITSTMTTGWHYLSDVLAGVLVAVVAMVVCRWLDGPLTATDRDAQPSPSNSVGAGGSPAQ